MFAVDGDGFVIGCVQGGFIFSVIYGGYTALQTKERRALNFGLFNW